MSKPLTLYFDIETNAIEDFTLLTDLEVIHCISIYEPQSEKIVTYSGTSIEEGLRQLDRATTIVGHNVINFDIPAIQKLYPWRPKARILDTLVSCRAVDSDIALLDAVREDFPSELMGSHSLKAWGHRLGMEKIEFGEESFDKFSKDMQLYCENDTILTAAVGQYLRQENPATKMLNIEHNFARLMRAQEFRGFAFDEDKARELVRVLTTRRAELTDDLQKMFPPVVEEMKTPLGWKLEIEWEKGIEVIVADTQKQIKEALKVRNLKQVLVKNAVRLENKTKQIPFNPSSRDQIADRLKELGWKPKVFTPNGKPKIDESVLEAIDHPSARKLNEYLMVSKRLSMLDEGDNSWLNCVRNGRIHGRVNSGGTVTGRCTHSFPNVAQVPAVRAPYGKECRELFRAGDGYKLVGCDASGLELRMLAHYLAIYDGGNYAKELLTGDIHSHNQKKAGLETRDQAKTFIYAFLYGAGPVRIGDIVGGTARDGKMLQKRFLASLPALARLKSEVEDRVRKHGRLRGIDGRVLPIRSEHSALNTLLQSAGAVVMKQSLIMLHNQLAGNAWEIGKHYAFVANIHDEFQAEVVEDRAERYGELAIRAIRWAGKHLKMRCPLDGEYKIGYTWADTH
jgi:DNA polymerase I-like protein with 3'-5' exonuclease and polymerase domains